MATPWNDARDDSDRFAEPMPRPARVVERKSRMKLREALDLIEFAMKEETVDRKAVRALVDDVRRTLLAFGINPDLPVVSEERPVPFTCGADTCWAPVVAGSRFCAEHGREVR
jgi:hypothetical protein